MDNAAIKAVVLDLFDTLVDWRADLLPEIEWSGRKIRSTIPWITPLLEEALGKRFERKTFLRVYGEVVAELTARRDREGIEITCHERFQQTLQRLGLPRDEQNGDLAEGLTRAHMNGIRRITSAPAARVDAVRRIARRYRLGLLSNFDDSRAGHEILEDTRVAHLFEAVVISADVGLRKPNPLIFGHALEQLQLQPEEVLFVGDTPHHDVAGSNRAGMRTAWINRHGGPLPEGVPTPDIIITDLKELPAKLGC